MSKYTEISQQLQAMEQGRFQIICIEYLKSKINGVIHSPGTVDGKEKTKKGHPDIYLRRDDGKYVLGECTTKDSLNTAAFTKKLEEDLKECLKFDKLQLSEEKVDSIYLCCNTSVGTSVFEHLVAIVKDYGIELKIISLYDLAYYFSTEGKVFAKDFMGIGFETGQVLSKEEFLKQYQKKNISTPLDNPIVGREKELSGLLTELNQHDLLLVNGPAGVGKSRLVMEAIDLFLAVHEEFTPYYIFPKSGEITEDLITFLKPGRSYILLIDDANRQLSNVIKILEKFVESEVRLKVIMTVRDYAKNDVVRQLENMNFNGFNLNKLSDETIIEIISQPPFSLKDWDIINHIVKISSGNPRIAIMAAEIMASNPDENILSDVTRIYDAYFDNILKDKEIFTKKHTRQVLGVISFFYTIDMKATEEQDIIRSFGLDVDEFIECSEQLEELEIVEIYEGSVVKISEQILATYFFFDCFFRKSVLDFTCLLAHCLEGNTYRLKDSVIPSIEAFGAEKVIVIKNIEWKLFWDKMKLKDETAISFMRIFGTYFPELFFSWISKYKNDCELSESNDYHYESLSKTHNNIYNDEILNLLENFYLAPLAHFQTAIHLSFAYAAGHPATLAILIDKLKTSLHINKKEILNGLPRISFVYDYLAGISERKFKYALYLIMDTVILRCSGRKESLNKVDDKYILKDIIKNLRSKLINDYRSDYNSEKPFIRSLLLNYVLEKRHIKYPEIEQDFGDISTIILTSMHPENFVECYFVNKYIVMVNEKSDLFSNELQSLLERFNTPTYQLYSLLSMDYSLIDENISWEEFQTLKTDIISKQIAIKSLEDFKNIYAKLIEIFEFEGFLSSAGDGVSIILRNILMSDFELGMECLEFYIKNGNIGFLNGVPIIAFIIMTGKESGDRLYQLMRRCEFQYRNEWIKNFFLYLPQDQIDDERIDQLIVFYTSYSGAVDIYPNHYIEYESYRPGTMGRIVEALYENRKANNKFIYKLSHSFFKESPELVTYNSELCQEVYFQQEEMPGTYDFHGRELIILIKNDSAFFYRYIDWLLNTRRNYYISDNKVLSGIWELSDAEKMVYRSLLRIVEIPSFLRVEHLSGIFFKQISKEHEKDGFKVLEKIVRDFPNNSDVLNIVIDTARNSMKPFYMELIQLIISQNEDIELFKKLQFHNNHFDSSEGTIWSAHKSKQLKEIMEAIYKMRDHYKYCDHKDYLNSQIENNDRRTRLEKKYIFRGFW